MPPPECASLISNLVLISSCCPLRRISWQIMFEERFFPISAIKDENGKTFYCSPGGIDKNGQLLKEVT